MLTYEREWTPTAGTKTRRRAGAQAARNALAAYQRNPDSTEALVRALRALQAVVKDQSNDYAVLRWNI